MASLFSYSWVEGTIVRVHSSGHLRMQPGELDLLQREIMKYYDWLQARFGKQPFRELVVLEKMAEILDADQEQFTLGTLSMLQAFNIERAAYVLDSTSMRAQFDRLFTQNELTDRFRTFTSEPEALEFLRAP
jgi:hypothetical protein